MIIGVVAVLFVVVISAALLVALDVCVDVAVVGAKDSFFWNLFTAMLRPIEVLSQSEPGFLRFDTCNKNPLGPHTMGLTWPGSFP